MTNARVALSIRHKQLIMEQFKEKKKEGTKLSQTALALWAKETLKLKQVPDQSTISRIVRDATRFEHFNINSNSCRARPPAVPRLEVALYRWMCSLSNNGVLINTEVVRMKAQKLLEEANKHLPSEKQLQLKFSKGWVERFKKRFGLRFRRIHGEAKSADNEAIAKKMPCIHMLMMTFDARDIWNADEFGLFYRQPPSWTLSRKVVSGSKKEKTRITFLACCNADGTEKMPLMIIGSALNPRAFKKKSGQELGFDYHANKKAWMNAPLFFSWLQRLDQFIGRQEGRKILLLIDNCSAHGTADSLPPLRNVRVQFLPPNTTSRVQPLDAGIIAWVKAKYKRRLLFRVFDNIDMGKKSIYNVDILTAMRWTKEEWESCPSSVIKNCFLHCLKQGENFTAEERGDIYGETVDKMVRDATEHGVGFTRIGLEYLLNPPEEDEVMEEVNLKDLGLEVAGVSQTESEDVGLEEPEEDLAFTVAQELEFLARARSILESRGELNEVGRKAFSSCQRTLRVEKVESMKQTTIIDHFQKK